MSRETRLYLDDMLEACRRVTNYTAGMTFEQFVADERTRDAVARNLEILGEAAKKVPTTFGSCSRPSTGAKPAHSVTCSRTPTSGSTSALSGRS